MMWLGQKFSEKILAGFRQVDFIDKEIAWIFVRPVNNAETEDVSSKRHGIAHKYSLRPSRRLTQTEDGEKHSCLRSQFRWSHNKIGQAGCILDWKFA